LSSEKKFEILAAEGMWLEKDSPEGKAIFTETRRPWKRQRISTGGGVILLDDATRVLLEENQTCAAEKEQARLEKVELRKAQS